MEKNTPQEGLIPHGAESLENLLRWKGVEESLVGEVTESLLSPYAHASHTAEVDEALDLVGKEYHRQLTHNFKSNTKPVFTVAELTMLCGILRPSGEGLSRPTLLQIINKQLAHNRGPNNDAQTLLGGFHSGMYKLFQYRDAPTAIDADDDNSRFSKIRGTEEDKVRLRQELMAERIFGKAERHTIRQIPYGGMLHLAEFTGLAYANIPIPPRARGNQQKRAEQFRMVLAAGSYELSEDKPATVQSGLIRASEMMRKIVGADVLSGALQELVADLQDIHALPEAQRIAIQEQRAVAVSQRLLPTVVEAAKMSLSQRPRSRHQPHVSAKANQ